MQIIHSIIGNEYDATVYTNGGTYHKVMIENVEDGRTEYFKFYSRSKAFKFAEEKTR